MISNDIDSLGDKQRKWPVLQKETYDSNAISNIHFCCCFSWLSLSQRLVRVFSFYKTVSIIHLKEEAIQWLLRHWQQQKFRSEEFFFLFLSLLLKSRVPLLKLPTPQELAVVAITAAANRCLRLEGTEPSTYLVCSVFFSEESKTKNPVRNL